MKKIEVISGVGSADTEMSAFDAALCDAGVGNYNLERLSSIVPVGYELVRNENLTYCAPPSAHGDRLKIVYATETARKIGKQAWAGIGWIILDETGAGLLIEHETDSEEKCRTLMETSLKEMCRTRGISMDDYPVDYEVIGIEHADEYLYSAAFVAAAFDRFAWDAEEQ